MKNLKLGWSCDATCLKLLSGPFESGVKNGGMDIICVRDIFKKDYEVKSFVDKIFKLVMNAHGPSEVIICISNIPEIITPEVYATLTDKQKDISQYTNRCFPTDMPAYKKALNDLVAEINRRNIMQHISWELSQEPDSQTYSWMSFEKWNEFTNIKYTVLAFTGRPMYIGDFTASIITKYDPAKQKWYDYINNSNRYNDPNVYYSTSFFLRNNKIDFNFSNNLWPTRKLNGRMVSAWNLSTGTKPDSAQEATMNSPKFIVRLIDTIRFLSDSEDKGYGKTDTLLIHTLLSCNTQTANRGLSLYEKGKTSGYLPKLPVWELLMEFATIIKTGYEMTPTGIKGATKEVVVSGDTYTIIPA